MSGFVRPVQVLIPAGLLPPVCRPFRPSVVLRPEKPLSQPQPTNHSANLLKREWQDALTSLSRDSQVGRIAFFPDLRKWQHLY